MPAKNKLIVLKFGGSVLLDIHSLRLAVHEIYRWRRDGYVVVAVVSALAGRTQELIKQCDSLCDSLSTTARAGVLAGGELESASLLGAHLDRAGIPSRVLLPSAVRMVANGDPLNAVPVSLDRTLIDLALSQEGVVVIPGFVSMDSTGSAVTLGRGGSDLSAVFLAHKLVAHSCRFIKDVDGLYESDPTGAAQLPRRFGSVNYADALQTDGSIIQHKALYYAQRFGIEIDLGRWNGVRPTRIFAGETKFDDTPDTQALQTLAVCGIGVVGGGVVQLVSQLPDTFVITGAACQSPAKYSTLSSLVPSITDDPMSLVSSGVDIVIELVGGIDVAWKITKEAIARGSHVVSANKALIAKYSRELENLNGRNQKGFSGSASVGGAMPILEAIQYQPVSSVYGVLNGTCNYVLGAICRGDSLNDATEHAQQLGFAEADPSRDLDGLDSLDKLLVIADTIGWDITHENQEVESIGHWLNNTDTPTRSCQIAKVCALNASVSIESAIQGSIFGQLENEWNAAVIEFEDGSTHTLRGKGAGRWPTSEAVLADLLEHNRSVSLVSQAKVAELA
jgi:homoserine dehydrogenase